MTIITTRPVGPPPQPPTPLVGPVVSVTFAQLLDRAAGHEFAALRVQADMFVTAAMVADLRPVIDENDVAEDWYDGPGGGPANPPGLPEVQVGAAAEYGARTKRSTSSAKALIRDAVVVRYRLPRVWRLVGQCRFRTGIARDVASMAGPFLPVEGWDWLDRALAAVPHQIGPVVAERIVGEALARFCPDTIEHRDARLYVTFDHRRTRGGVDRTCLNGQLDPADAADLDAALAAVAADLAAAGDTSGLDARRAKAAGMIGQAVLGQASLPIPSSDRPCHADDPASEVRPTGGAGPGRVVRVTPVRPLRLYVRLTEQAITAGLDAEHTTTLGPTGQPITVDLVRHWCHQPGAQITVAPVRDLTTPIRSTSYPPTDAQREQVALIDSHCVFPWCGRPVHPVPANRNREDQTLTGSWDADHIVPYQAGDVTSTEDLAPLCRTHHGLKTTEGWRYRRVAEHGFVWASPSRHTFLVTPDTTIELTDLVSTLPRQRDGRWVPGWLEPGPTTPDWRDDGGPEPAPPPDDPAWDRPTSDDWLELATEPLALDPPKGPDPPAEPGPPAD